MKSLLAERSRDDLAAQLRRMTVDERLLAFLAHCQLVAALNQAGKIVGPRAPPAESPSAR
jgi:hypothetical protein